MTSSQPHQTHHTWPTRQLEAKAKEPETNTQAKPVITDYASL